MSLFPFEIPVARLLLEIALGVLVILAVRFLFGRKLGPNLCRWLWILVAVRALTPLTVPVPYHPAGAFRDTVVRQVALEPDRDVVTPKEPPLNEIGIDRFDEAELIPVLPEPVADMPEPFSIRSSVPWLIGLWLVGMIAVLVTAWTRNRRIIERATREPTPVSDHIQAIFLEARRDLNIRAWPVLIVTPYVPAPCLVGAIRPRILIPEALADPEVDPEDVRYMILHELAHLKSGDIWFSWLWTLVVAVHWFNPLFWLLGRFVKLDCETACDRYVLDTSSGPARRDYAVSLVNIMKALNPHSGAYFPGACAVIETPSLLERRLTMITLYRTPNRRRTVIGVCAVLLLALLTLTGYAQPKPVPAEKAKMMGYVEDFFMRNARDITMRKSLQWGDVVKEKDGNATIRYRCEALVWDKDRMIFCWDFTFGKNGQYVSMKRVDGFPKPVVIEKPDTSTTEGMKKLVEKFFTQNFRDISARDSLEWGEPETSENGDRSIRYEYRATIWGKDKIVDCKVWTFTGEGEFVSVKDVEGFPKPVSGDGEDRSDKEQAVDRFLESLDRGEFGRARAMGIDLFKAAVSEEELKKIWNGLTSTYGKFVEASKTQSKPGTTENLLLFDKPCRFEKATVLLRVTVDADRKIAGFFILGAEKTSKETDKGELSSQKPDPRGSQRAAAKGWQSFMQGKPDEAEPHFAEAVKLNPKNGNAYQGLGWAQLNQGLVEDARNSFDRCLKLDPKNAAALNGLGVIARNAGDEEEMLRLWLRAVESDKKATGPMAGLAEYYEQKGEKKEAAKYYRMWSQADPSDQNAKEGLKRNTE